MKDLVLVGGGHSHVAVLKRFGMEPMPGVRVTLISRDVETPYSGMLPGLVAGHYTRDEGHIDLGVLGRFAGARTIFAEATGLDLASRLVQVQGHPSISYDILSIDIGSTPNVTVPGAAEHAVPVKPIDRFLDRWERLMQRVATDVVGAAFRRPVTKADLKVGLDERSAAALPARIAVVGGGAGGVELILAVQFRLQVECHLFTGPAGILPTHNARAREILRRAMLQRGIVIHTGSRVVHVSEGRLRTEDGAVHQVDEVLWTTEAQAASWLREAGLAVDEAGFVRVSPMLQSVSHPDVFAAGDVAAMEGHRLPKSGVYAVRQGPPLAANLRRALLGEPLRVYRPQRRALSLISTGDKFAVASYGPVAFSGAWVWRWKDSIDRRFMRTYSELPEMKESPNHGDTETRGSADEALRATVPPWPVDAMRCGGCGAKVGSDILERVLGKLDGGTGPGVVIGVGDDAAVVQVPDGKLLVQTVDFFRAIVDDPFTFGRIAATHALGDIYAMGGDPQTALAIVTVPHGPEQKVEDTLSHLLAGAVDVLHEAGAMLVGGHTGEGAELAVGFSVNGLVSRDRVLRKSGLRAGDRLLLTKPLGTGALFAADMRHKAKGRWIVDAIGSMLQSNRAAAATLMAHRATACTDVTGFGLLGHLVEMLKASAVDAQIDLAAVPLLAGAEETVRAGIFSSLQPQNLRLRRAIVNAGEVRSHPNYPLLFDPQTAGGLLAGVPPDALDACLEALRAQGYPAVCIGTVRKSAGRPEVVTLHVGADLQVGPAP